MVIFTRILIVYIQITVNTQFRFKYKFGIVPGKEFSIEAVQTRMHSVYTQQVYGFMHFD